MIAPQLLAGLDVLITAHGNSLRALLKHLEGVSDAEISDVNIQTGAPRQYVFDDGLGVIGATPGPALRSRDSTRGESSHHPTTPDPNPWRIVSPPDNTRPDPWRIVSGVAARRTGNGETNRDDSREAARAQ